MTRAHRTVGSLQLPLAGLGCGNFGEFLDRDSSREVVDAALDAGITHFDTADVYGDGASEEYLGRALGTRRGQVAITTKFGAVPSQDGARPGSRESVRRSCEASLRRLGRDWIDVYLFHHPDPGTQIGETLAEMAALRDEGKVLEIGYSNVTPAQMEEAHRAAEQLGIEGFATVQNAYSLLDRTPERELLPLCRRLGISIIPYLPLAGGMLTGKYRRGEPFAGSSRMSRNLRGAAVGDYFPALFGDACFDLVESLERFAAERGHTLVELAFGWLAARSEVACIIAGATTPQQVRGNFAAIESWELHKDERAAVDGMTRVDVSFAWHPGMPEYAQPPADAARSAPDLRQNVAAERAGKG